MTGPVQLEANLYGAVFGLRDAYSMALSMEDTDKCVSYCRVFTEMGETMLTNIINHDPGENHSGNRKRAILPWF